MIHTFVQVKRVVFCTVVFAISSAAQTGTVPLDGGTAPSGFTNSTITELNGNVGIGTTNAPQATLEVNGTAQVDSTLSVKSGWINLYGGSAVNQISTARNSGEYLSNALTGDLTIRSLYNHVVIGGASSNGVVFDGGGNMFVYGNVGIGTTSPGAKLEVAGNLKLSAGTGASIIFPDNTTQATAWTGSLCGGDYAESVDVSGDRKAYEPGDVLVVDPNNPGRFLKASEPYSTLVAGIYSTKPGVIGRRQTSDPATSLTEVPMAMVGIVPTKVSTENGPIRPGDLLVTSSTSDMS